MDEVETNGSIRDAATVSERRKAVVNGIPFYLLVPRGFKDSVQKMLPSPLAESYEYTLGSDLSQVV